MSKEIIKDVVTEGAKATPPVAVVTTSIAQGWTINNTVGALPVISLPLQAGRLGGRWHRDASGQPVKGE